MTADLPPTHRSGAQEADRPDEVGTPTTPDSGDDRPPPRAAQDAERVCGVPRDQARAAKSSLAQALAGDPEIRGVGLSREADGGYVLVVNISTHKVQARVPGLVDGTPVRTRVTGEIHTLPE